MVTLLDAEAWSLFFEAVPLAWPLLAAVLGALAASFAGVVALRLPRMMGWARPDDTTGEMPACETCGAPASQACDAGVTLSGRSCCDGCGKVLPWHSLIPVVGWLLHRGRCGSCGHRVSGLYPAIEALTALLSVGLALRFGPGIDGTMALGVLWVGVALSWVDWRESLLPDSITSPLLLVGLAASPFEPEPLARIHGLVAALGAYWLTFRIVSILKGVDAMALGDLALAAAAGAWLGLDGVPVFLLANAAFYCAYALPLRLRGRVWVPMGPAMAAALVACIWLGPAFPI